MPEEWLAYKIPANFIHVKISLDDNVYKVPSLALKLGECRTKEGCGKCPNGTKVCQPVPRKCLMSQNGRAQN